LVEQSVGGYREPLGGSLSLNRDVGATEEKQMTISPAKVIGIICILAGLTWSVFFPKSNELLRPDFVASVAVGLGLIIPGVIVLFFTRKRAAVSALAILLVWSVLLNACLFSWARAATDFIRKNAEQSTDP
jgi:predicted acyltransferase